MGKASPPLKQTWARLLYAAGRSGAKEIASSKILRASSRLPDPAARMPEASIALDFLEKKQFHRDFLLGQTD